MKIRRATSNDLPCVLELMLCFLSEANIQHFPSRAVCVVVEHINDPDKATFVVEKNGQIVGFMSAFLDQNLFTMKLYARDRACFVLPEHRSMKVTLGLYRAFKTWAKEQNCSQVLLSILMSKDNMSLKRVLEWFGCKTAGYLLFDEI